MGSGLFRSSCSAVFALRSSACLLACGVLVSGCFDPGDGDAEAGATEVAASSDDAAATDEAEPATDEGTDAAPDTGAAEASTGADDGEEDDAADLQAACEDYCGIIEDHCEGELAQYDGTAVCEATCAQMQPGEADDTLGNSVACRSFHALLAARSPDPHCLHAGPAGDGTCGANCENFCTLALDICEGDLSPYVDADACIAACEAFPEEPAYTSSVPDGDSFACRMRHLTLAAAQPDAHCSHIGADSPVCFD